jgi:hypothetical protein
MLLAGLSLFLSSLVSGIVELAEWSMPVILALGRLKQEDHEFG